MDIPASTRHDCCPPDLDGAKLLQFAFDHLGDGILWLTEEGRVIYANHAACRALHYTREELLECRIADIDTSTNETSWPTTWSQAKGQYALLTEALFQTRNAQLLPVEVMINHCAYLGQEFICALMRDISGRKQMEELIHLSSAIYMSSSEAILVTDENNRITQVNPAFTRITGYQLSDLLGKNPSILQSELHDQEFYRDMWHDINLHGHWQGELWDRRKNGELFASWVTISLIRNSEGKVFRHVAQFSDITEKKKQDELIWKHANFDALTGLPNRRLFYDRLEQEVKKAHRNGHPLSLLFVDLDDFKQINDHFGHAMGDRLLTETAQRLQLCVRNSDTVARLGGDEFTVILPDASNREDVERIVQTIIHELSTPFELETGSGVVSASVGIAQYPTDADSISALLVLADQAMYRAKKNGRNCYAHASQEAPKVSEK